MVTKAKVNWSTYFQNMFRPRFGGGFDDYSDRGPSVVAQNCDGDSHVVEVAKSMKEARDRAIVIERDFNTLDAAQWCARYDVPRSFVSGAG